MVGIGDAQAGTASFSRVMGGGAAASNKLRETFRFMADGKQLEISGQLHVGSRYMVEKRVLNASTTFFHSALHARAAQVEWELARQPATDPLMYLIAPLTGDCRIQQLGMDDRFSPGQIGMFTSAESFAVEFDGNSRSVVAVINESRLTQSVRGATSTLGRPMTAEGAGGLLIRHLDATMRIAHTLNPLSLTAATNAATALVYATLTESISGQKSYDRNALRDQIAIYIESRLNDSSLSVEEIAAAHHVSVRTLYRLFSDTSDTVSAYIRDRRLERSRAEIIARPDLSIAEICMRWGVGEPKHFSRYYRARFGETPRETRMQARAASARRPAVPDDVQADGSIAVPQATTGTTLSCRPEPS